MPWKEFIFVLLFGLCLLIQVDGVFWRRRRRTFTPPPPQRCTVSEWTSWSACSQLCSVGVKKRTRSIVTPAMWSGDCPYELSESDTCGSARGGCQQICRERDGQCSCQTGFSLSGKNCYDINECASNGGKGPCSDICRNTVGSFHCQCPTGYYLHSNKHNCLAYDCGHPSTLFSSCPSNSYKDHISHVCKQVTVSCSQGTTFNKQCTLVCPQNYSLSVIVTQQNQQFGEDYSSVDFSSVQSTISCDKRQPGQSDVWSVKKIDLSKYFCRRTNDPPTDLNLNGSALMEHANIGTVIGVLSSQDAQQGQSFTYSIEQSNNLLATQGDQLINVWDDPRLNGNVSLSSGSTLEVRIRSTDDGVPAMWLERTFHITVVDVNDPPDAIQLSNTIIYENATLGMVVGFLTAIDGDDPPGTNPHSNFDWRLVGSDNGNFAIVGNSVRVDRSLQGEGNKIHKIVVNCSDFGIPPPIQSKVTNFVINVLDINEVPVSLTLSKATVSEGATVGSVVGQLVVTEKDGDDVSIDISQSDPVTLDKFIINKAGCQGPGHAYDCKVDLVVNSSLNYEAKPWYKINVHANDTQGSISKQFHINVVNENEAPTGIDLTGSHSVTENAAAGTAIGQLVVTDPDNANSPLYQSHTCFLGDEKYFIISSGLVLQVQGAFPIDYEKVKNFTVQVTCKDSGHPSLSLSKVFVILVKDVNESPRNLRLSNVNINENSPMGTPVGNLLSDDPDGPDDIHTYSIVGPTDAPFFLGGIYNQTLLASGPLDHEVNPILLVIIRVTDSEGLFVQKTFKISVNDVNDPPTNLTLLTPFVMENSHQKVLISPIIFYDQDADVALCHLVDSAGGRVEVLGTNLLAGPTPTDFESLPPPKQLHIQLNCSDQHGLFIEKSFVIQVKDVNERPSQVTLDGNTVKENEVGGFVGKVTVSDPDIGQNHKCDVYDLVVDSATSTESLKGSRFFTVDDSFNLTTYNSLNFEEAHTVDIIINCSDVVSPPQRRLFKTTLFTITVKDVNEKPSALCNNPIYIDIHTSDGSVIAELHGRDPDNENAINRDSGNHTVIVNQKQQLQYVLSPAQNSWPFTIDQNNLFTNGAITKPQNITINVKVEDDGVIVGRFSSTGFQYIRVKPLSAVFNCTIIVTEKAIVEGAIRLEPSQVSVTALDGSLVGQLTTVTKFPHETFTYELEDVESLPFDIDRNKLLVAGKDIKDFRVSGSEEFIIPVTITSRGNISQPTRRSFYVRIIDDGLEPINMCLVPDFVREDTTPGTVVGQLIIDDSSSPLSSCVKKHCCSTAGMSFNYKCRVDEPEENDVTFDNLNLVRNGSRLVSLRDDFLLRTKLSLKYSDFAGSNGSLGIHISCRGTQYPLLFFGQLIRVHVLYCDGNSVCPASDECPRCQHGGACQNVITGYRCTCAAGFTGAQCEARIDHCQGNPCLHGGICENDITEFKCGCIDGFSGNVCERKESLCAECEDGTLCVTFVDAAIRCLEKKYQVPILVNENEITLKRIAELENEIASILEKENDNSGNQGSRKRRASFKFYVEILQNIDVSSQSLLILTVLDSGKQFFPLLASEACPLLKNTDKKCLEDCDILKLADLPCTGNEAGSDKNIGELDEGESTGRLTAPTISGIAVAVVIVIFAILVGTVFYYRRKYKAARQSQAPVYFQTEREHVDFSNSLYDDNRRARIPPPSSQEWEKRLKKDSDVFAQHNLDPAFVVKRNDIKVSANALYEDPKSNRVPHEPGSSLSKKSVNLSDENDTQAAKSPLRKGTDYSKDEGRKASTEEGMLNPLYMVSPPVTRLADKAATGSVFDVGTKSQKETLTPEEDLDDYLKDARVKARANNYSQPGTLNRQGSDGDPNRWPRRMNETLSSFGNPVYDDLAPNAETPTTENGGYSTIPALHDATYSTIPALHDATYSTIPGPQDDTGASRGIYESLGPPRTTRRSSSEPPETVEVVEDNRGYARLNFGDAQA